MSNRVFTKGQHTVLRTLTFHATQAFTRMRGLNKDITRFASETTVTADEARYFIDWCHENGFLNTTTHYFPSTLREMIGTEDTVFGWCAPIPETEDEDGKPEFVIVCYYKTWLVLLHELAHVHSMDYGVSIEDSAEHDVTFCRAMRNMIIAFRAFREEE